MKRARIALLAIAILATVSGTLAFKAQQKFGAVIYLGTAENAPATITKSDWTITTTTTASFTFATTSFNQPALSTYITTLD